EDYGFRIQIIGDTAFITRTRPGTDAVEKVKPGDQVVTYNNYSVNRDDLWKMDYYFNRLAPLMQSNLVLRDPHGQTRQITVDAKMKQEKRVLDFTGADGDGDIWQMVREEENEDHLVRERYYEMGDVLIWKMPEFDLEDSKVDHMFGIA